MQRNGQGLADFGKPAFLNNRGSTKCIKYERLSQESVVQIHFLFLNDVDFFQRMFCLVSKQLNLVRLQILKEALQ